jgi:DNA-binding transcriptional ArsR family regulator
LGSALTLTALVKTTFERLMSKQYKWSNTWARNYGNNPIKKDEKLSELEKKFFDLVPKTEVTDLATLEKELSEPIRFTELETKQTAENIIKEFVKNVDKKKFDHYRPKIIGMLKTYKEMFGEDGLEISLKTLFEKGTLDVYKPTYHHWKKSTEKRNRVIELVGRGYTTISQIAHETGFSYSSVYYHTKILEKSNHLKRNKIGRKIEVKPKLGLGKKVKTYLGLDNQNPFKIKPEIDSGIKTLPPEKIVNILQSMKINENHFKRN